MLVHFPLLSDLTIQFLKYARKCAFQIRRKDSFNRTDSYNSFLKHNVGLLQHRCKKEAVQPQKWWNLHNCLFLSLLPSSLTGPKSNKHGLQASATNNKNAVRHENIDLFIFFFFYLLTGNSFVDCWPFRSHVSYCHLLSVSAYYIPSSA